MDISSDVSKLASQWATNSSYLNYRNMVVVVQLLQPLQIKKKDLRRGRLFTLTVNIFDFVRTWPQYKSLFFSVSFVKVFFLPLFSFPLQQSEIWGVEVHLLSLMRPSLWFARELISPPPSLMKWLLCLDSKLSQHWLNILQKVKLPIVITGVIELQVMETRWDKLTSFSVPQ